MAPVGARNVPHQRSALSSGTGRAGAEKTTDPATRLSRGTPGRSSARGVRSATVTYPVAFTKAANSAVVTSVASIQNGSTKTRWMGRESVVCFIPTRSISGGSAAPIENSPPGIQTMPTGAGRGAVIACGMVGPKIAADAVEDDGAGIDFGASAFDCTSGPDRNQAYPAATIPTSNRAITQGGTPARSCRAADGRFRRVVELMEWALRSTRAPGRLALFFAIEIQPIRHVVLVDVADVLHGLPSDLLGDDLLDVVEPDVGIQSTLLGFAPQLADLPGPALYDANVIRPLFNGSIGSFL